MKRYLSYLSALVATVVIWFIIGIYGYLNQNKDIVWIFHVLPFIILIYFGCYCLLRLGWDLLMFNDFPSEVGALAKDILEARDYLKGKGFKSN